MKRTLLIPVAILMLTMTLHAQAAGLGSIEIILSTGNQPIQAAEISVCYLGHRVSGGYQLKEAFGGGVVSDLDLLSPELPLFLARKAGGGSVCQTNQQGIASFQLLREGLYLAYQKEGPEGYYPMEPFLITLPWDGSIWDIQAAPKMEEIPPDTSDPEYVLWGSWGMVLSASALGLLLSQGKRKRGF